LRIKGLGITNALRFEKPSFGSNKSGYFWHAGLAYRPTKKLMLCADTFNILAWFGEMHNKRNDYFRGSEYSVEEAAVAISARLEV
jgi:hypothetical protein